MQSNSCRKSLVLSGLIAVATSASAQAVSTFDEGLDGWTVTRGSVSFVSTGGNPGGFLQQTDDQNLYMGVRAPAQLLGDLSAYFGGTISFDAKNISNTPLNPSQFGPLFGTVNIQGTSGFASKTLFGTAFGLPSDGQWHTYSATLDAASWGNNLRPILSNVTGIFVQLEFNSLAFETVGFDNFRVSAVPEISTSASLLAGLAMVLLVGKRRP